jgi:DNA/RNA-binding domain of Phe-tRNA-synthetase-like protein
VNEKAFRTAMKVETGGGASRRRKRGMTRDTLQFHISPDVLARGLTVACLTIGPLRNTPTSPEFQRFREEVLREIQQDLTPEQIEMDPTLQGFRRLHEAFGVSNRRNIAAPENLLRFLLKTGDLPRINLAVDLYNLVSVKTRLSLGAHDIARLVGDIHLRRTDGTEECWPLGAAAPKGIAPGEYAYIDSGANEVICRLEVRQGEKTRVTEETTDCFYILQGNAFTPAASVQAAARLLMEWTRRFLGGEARLLYAPWQAHGALYGAS